MRRPETADDRDHYHHNMMARPAAAAASSCHRQQVLEILFPKLPQHDDSGAKQEQQQVEEENGMISKETGAADTPSGRSLRYDVESKRYILDGDEDGDEVCVICLDELGDKQGVCGACNLHYFHYDCIMNWMCTDHDECPTCRQPLWESETYKVIEDELVLRNHKYNGVQSHPQHPVSTAPPAAGDDRLWTTNDPHHPPSSSLLTTLPSEEQQRSRLLRNLVILIVVVSIVISIGGMVIASFGTGESSILRQPTVSPPTYVLAPTPSSPSLTRNSLAPSISPAPTPAPTPAPSSWPTAEWCTNIYGESLTSVPICGTCCPITCVDQYYYVTLGQCICACGGSPLNVALHDDVRCICTS